MISDTSTNRKAYHAVRPPHRRRTKLQTATAANDRKRNAAIGVARAPSIPSRNANVPETTWTDGTILGHKVYAGTRYQYGIKAYFTQRLDPVSGDLIGGNENAPLGNYNLGIIGPLKATIRITTRVLNAVEPGTKQLTVKWGGSKNFTGYEVQIATDANFTENVQSKLITAWKPFDHTFTNLKSGTTYYVTIRSYHEFNGMTYFGEWSNVLSCKVK